MDSNFVILVSVFCFLLVVVFFYYYLKQQERSLRIWVNAGIIYIAEFILDMFYNHYSSAGMPPLIAAFDWVLLLWGSLLMTWGTYVFIGKSLPKGLLYSFLAVMLLSVLNVAQLNSLYLFILSYVFYGLGFVWAGLLLFSYRAVSSIWKYLASISLVLWGLDLSLFRIVRSVPGQPTWYKPSDYLFAVIFSVMAVLGLLMISLQKKENQDKEKVDLMQYIAHDLKTKVLIIQNYISSIQNKIYPNGSLENSLKVIDEEAETLGSHVRSILYFNKLNHAQGKIKHEKFYLNELIAHCVELFRWRRAHLQWETKMEAVQITGDPAQWKVIIENVLDNQTRFAKGRIKISLQITGKKERALLRIWNDGPEIETELLHSIFEVYSSGKGSKSGLGMYIVKKSLDAQQAEIQVVNEDDGVAYLINLKCG
jgi:signal transduction histidine kinase